MICAFAAAARQGAIVEEIEAFADAFVADPRVVALVPGGQGNLSHRDVLRLDDGRVVPAMGHATRYTTHELLALEREVINRALGERAVGAAVAEPAAVERAIAARPTIGADQAAMVRRLCSDGHGVQVVVGPPGTSKTFALDAAREAWEASGYVTFPGEIFAAPRSGVETVYPNLTYFNEVDSGGHFPAWEEPELFSTEVRAAFSSLR